MFRKQSEKEMVEIIKNAGVLSKRGVQHQKDLKDLLDTQIKLGQVRRNLGGEVFDKVSFNRYVMKNADEDGFWKIEEIDGEEYFVIVDE